MLSVENRIVFRIEFRPDRLSIGSMKILTIIARILLGLVFTVFGSNAFIHFMPVPEMTGYPAQFIGSMAATGFLQAVAAFQVAGGLLLLIGRFVPLGLTLLGPLIVNILMYHCFMDHNGLPIALVVCALEAFLIWQYRAAFAGILRA
jgi:putative oxidoreductase